LNAVMRRVNSGRMRIKPKLVVAPAFSILLLTAGYWAHSDSGPQVAQMVVFAHAKAAPEKIPVPAFAGMLTTALTSVGDSITPVLERSEAQRKSWQLNSVGVGLGLSGQIGIGPLLHVSVTPQLRLVFTNSLTPVYPN
jgi:hypothetical protein